MSKVVIFITNLLDAVDYQAYFNARVYIRKFSKIGFLLFSEDEPSPGAEKSGSTVRVPRADDETFQAFFTPVLEKQDLAPAVDLDMDLDAIDSGSRQL